MTEYQINKFIEMKERIILQVENKEMKVQDGAKLIGISRQGFTKLRKKYRKHGEIAITGRKRGPKSWHRPWNRTSEQLEEFVKKYKCEHPQEGPITISWKLEDEYGIKLPSQTIYKILKRKGVYPKADKSRTRKWKDVIITRLGEVMQLDTCFPWGKEGPCVIQVVDVLSRWAYGRLYDKATMKNAADFVKRLVEKVPFNIECLQPDNGSEFQSTFRKAAEKHGIKWFPIPPYSPNCNGRVERLHRTTKDECYYYLPYNWDLVKKNYFTEMYFVTYYNAKRRHQGKEMNMMTPNEKILSHLKSNMYKGNLSMIQYKN